MASVADLVGTDFPRPFLACTDFDHLLGMLEQGSASEVLLELGPDEPAALDCLCLLYRLGQPVIVRLATASLPDRQAWKMPPWMRLHERRTGNPIIREELIRDHSQRPSAQSPLRVGDILTLIEAGNLSLHSRLTLEGRGELELVSHEGEIWSALLGDTLGSEALTDTLFETVSSSYSREQGDVPESRWVVEDMQTLFRMAKLENPCDQSPPSDESRGAKVVCISRASRNRGTVGETHDQQNLPNSSEESQHGLLGARKVDTASFDIEDALGKAMEIHATLGAGLADYEAGVCLGARSRETGMAMERLVEENTGLVRTKLKTLRQRGLEDKLEEFVISLGRTFHLMIPIADQTLILYITLDRDRANLALARLKAHALVAQLRT